MGQHLPGNEKRRAEAAPTGPSKQTGMWRGIVIFDGVAKKIAAGDYIELKKRAVGSFRVYTADIAFRQHVLTRFTAVDTQDDFEMLEGGEDSIECGSVRGLM